MSTTASEQQPNPTATTTDPPAVATTTEDQPLGEGGKKALEAERSARQALEKQIKTLTDGLAALSGEPKSTDPIASLTARLEALETSDRTKSAQLKVAELARDNGITDADDIKLMQSATDDESLNLLVKRLKPQAGTPKPDLTQGGSGGTNLALNSDGLTEAIKQALHIT